MDEKQQIEASQTGEAFYQSILSYSKELISISDQYGQILYVSEKLAEHLGRESQALLRTNLSELFSGPENSGIEHFFSGSHISPGCSQELTFGYRALNDQAYSLNAVVTNLLGDPAVRGMLIRYDDPQEVKPEEVIVTEANLKAVFESSNDGFIITDRNLNIQSFNRIAKEQVEIHSGGKILKECSNILDYISPEENEQFRDVFGRVLQGKDFRANWTYGIEDGEKWTQYCIYPVREQDEVIGTCIVGRDITEAKNAEDRLRLSEERYRTLIREGSDLTNIIDFEGNYMLITSALKSVLDPRSIGKNAFEFVHPEDRERLKMEFQALKNTRRLKSTPYRFQVNENEYFWLETVGTNLMDDPSIQGIVINSHDVTDTINHIKEIEHRNELLEEIAWTQSHVVRAPLARILGIIEILRSSKDELEELLPYLEEAGKELDEVIKDITRKSRELGDRSD